MDDGEEGFTEEDLAVMDSKVEKFIGNSATKKEKCEDYIGIFQTDFDLCNEFCDDNEPALEHLECLKSKFGHGAFRHKQWEIIRAVMCERRDVLAVMATGHGKSLCFQFPAVFKKGMTFVISPLIALMEAQAYTMNEAGISACFLGSAQTDKNILQRIKRREFSIIYCCPEFLQGYNGAELLTSIKDQLTLIAIDEAHSISQWGHDFRTDYRKLTIIRQIIPDVPILAVTATATENVRHDIVGMLSLKSPRIIVTSFDRPNLEFIVNRKTSFHPWTDLKQWVQNVNGSVIIYVLKRDETSEISALLALHGIESETYHAKLPLKTRSDVVKKFIRNEIKVVVATIAFGMGIDKPDIRYVINYGASKNLETYYQEVGRAGRDGCPAKVVTYFNEEDFRLQEYFLKCGPKEELSRIVLNHLRGLGAKFRSYLKSTECRRKTILKYFGEDASLLAPRPNCCDNCTRGLRARTENPVIALSTPAPIHTQSIDMNPSTLSKILLQVRDAIAAAKNISNNGSIANAAALEKMVSVPPKNFDEFRNLGLDGFTIEKIYKFGPTFVNAVDKYSRGQLEMRNILKSQPMIVHRGISPNLIRLIEAKKSKEEIIRALNYSNEDQFISNVEFLIRTGHHITKEHIKTISNASYVNFSEFGNNIDDIVMQSSSVTREMLREIHTNYYSRSGIRVTYSFIRLAIAYFNVRDCLNRLDEPYFDFDENILQNAHKLLAEERVAPTDHSFEAEVNVQPYRSRNVEVRNIVDMIFGDCVFCDHDHSYDSDDSVSGGDGYDEYEMFNDSEENNGNSSSEPEDEQESGSENEEGSSQENEDYDVQDEESSNKNGSVADDDEEQLSSAGSDNLSRSDFEDNNPHSNDDDSENEGSIIVVSRKRQRLS